MAPDLGRGNSTSTPRKRLEEALLRIAEGWNLTWINAADYKRLAIIEGCAHELAHALDLGVDFEDLLQEMPDEESNNHEASVLRIETSALDSLGIHLSMRRLRQSANWDGPDGIPSHAELKAPLNRHEQHCAQRFVALVTHEIRGTASSTLISRDAEHDRPNNSTSSSKLRAAKAG